MFAAISDALARIDWTVVFCFVVFGGGFLYAHKSLKGSGIADLAKGLAGQAVQHALMGATGILDGITPQNAADRLDGWVWTELGKHGIAKNAALDLLVKPAIADGVSRVLEGLRSKIAAEEVIGAASAPLMITKTPEAGFAKLGLMIIVAIVGSLFMFVGCGASQRQKTIAATYATLIAADQQLLAFNGPREAEIQTKAPNEAQGIADLADYRKKVDEAEKTIDAGYRAVAAAAIANNDQSLAALLQVWAIASSELHDLGVLK